jgi:mRNA interferase RelE/StbE
MLRLEDNPRPQGVERLEAKEKLYRLYVGPGKDYRVIYQIRDEVLVVLVVRVGDRKEVYRNLK